MRAHGGALLIDVGIVEIGLGQRAADRLGARARRQQRRRQCGDCGALQPSARRRRFRDTSHCSPYGASRVRRRPCPCWASRLEPPSRARRRDAHKRRTPGDPMYRHSESPGYSPAVNSTPNLPKIQATVAFLRHPSLDREFKTRRARRAITLPRSKGETRRPLERLQSGRARLEQRALVRNRSPTARSSAASGAPVAGVDADQPAARRRVRASSASGGASNAPSTTMTSNGPRPSRLSARSPSTTSIPARPSAACAPRRRRRRRIPAPRRGRRDAREIAAP